MAVVPRTKGSFFVLEIHADEYQRFDRWLCDSESKDVLRILCLRLNNYLFSPRVGLYSVCTEI